MHLVEELALPEGDRHVVGQLAAYGPVLVGKRVGFGASHVHHADHIALYDHGKAQHRVKPHGVDALFGLRNGFIIRVRENLRLALSQSLVEIDVVERKGSGCVQRVVLTGRQHVGRAGVPVNHCHRCALERNDPLSALNDLRRNLLGRLGSEDGLVDVAKSFQTIGIPAQRLLGCFTLCNVLADAGESAVVQRSQREMHVERLAAFFLPHELTAPPLALRDAGDHILVDKLNLFLIIQNLPRLSN